MLVTLKHLLVTVGLFMMGLLILPVLHDASDRFAAPEAVAVPVMIALGCGAVIFLSWPVYRVLHLRPLILPICPRCGKRHTNYHVPAAAWPDAVLVCVHCEAPLRLLLTRKAPPNPPTDIPTDIPTVNLRWPEFLGMWRKV